MEMPWAERETINGNIPEYFLHPFADALKYRNTENILEFKKEKRKNFALSENFNDKVRILEKADF